MVSQMKLAAPSWPFDHILRLTRMYSGLAAELLALLEGLKLLVARNLSNVEVESERLSCGSAGTRYIRQMKTIISLGDASGVTYSRTLY